MSLSPVWWSIKGDIGGVPFTIPTQIQTSSVQRVDIDTGAHIYCGTAYTINFEYTTNSDPQTCNFIVDQKYSTNLQFDC